VPHGFWLNTHPSCQPATLNNKLPAIDVVSSLSVSLFLELFLKSQSTSTEISRSDKVYFWHEADSLKARLERDIDFHTLKITLLGDSGYALAGYEY